MSRARGGRARVANRVGGGTRSGSAQVFLKAAAQAVADYLDTTHAGPCEVCGGSGEFTCPVSGRPHAATCQACRGDGHVDCGFRNCDQPGCM